MNLKQLDKAFLARGSDTDDLQLVRMEVSSLTPEAENMLIS